MCEETFPEGMRVPDPDWQALQGESFSFTEILAVAPIAGRVRLRQLEIGACVTRDTVLGDVVSGNGEGTCAVTAPSDGVFLGWLAWDGESVGRGTLLARLHPNRNGQQDHGARHL